MGSLLLCTADVPILTHEERVGTLVGKYRLEGILGEGGMGVVYRATNTATGRLVAIKVLRQPLVHDPSAYPRFEREARAAATLRHPNVIDVLDLGTSEDGAAFMVLELLEGESLGDLLDRAAPLSPEQTLRILLPVVDVLVQAHAQGFAHRDLKPENIFLARGPDGSVTPKLLDFGLAKPLQTEEAIRLTATGNVFGTPAYMSPEQAQGMPNVEHTFDLWAVGVLLFEALTGRPPFEAPTAAMLMNKLLSERAPRVRDLAPEVPPAVARVVDRALHPQLAKRYADATALKEALEGAAAAASIELPAKGAPILGLPAPSEGPTSIDATLTQPVHAPPVPRPRGRGRTLGLLVAGLGLGALLLAIALALRPNAAADRTAPGSPRVPPAATRPTAPPGSATSDPPPSLLPEEVPTPASVVTPPDPPQPMRQTRPVRPSMRPRPRPATRGATDRPGLATMSALPALRGWMQ